jgi:RND family efflux transporter MFP subunit
MSSMPRITVPQKITRPVLFILLLLAFVLAGWQLLANPPVKTQELKVVVPSRVEVVRVRSQDVQPFDRITGRLQPVRRSELRVEVAGNLLERRVEAGQQVDAGELLLRLDDGDYRDAVLEAEARLAQERAAQERDRQLLELMRRNVRLAQAETDRLARLGKDSLTSQSKMDETRQRLLQAQGEQARLEYSVSTGDQRLAVLASSLERARRNLQRTHLTAPYSGRVNRVLVEVGDHLSTGTLVLELIDDGALDLYAEVSGTSAAALETGQRLEVVVGDRSLIGELIALQLDPDQDTFTHPLKIRLSGEGLLPGMLASVRLPLAPRSDALVVPLSALLQEEGQSYVFVVKDDRLERRPVVPGIRAGNLRVIRSGLALDEVLVARDVAALSDDQQVIIQSGQAARQ